MKALVLLLIPTCLLGCPIDRESDYDRADRTPDGWHVEYGDQGSAAYWSRSDVYAEFDRRMREINSPYAGGILYQLIDHTHFPIDGVYAVGAFTGQRIIVAVYPTSSLPAGSDFPPESLPWTRRIGQTTGLTYFATWPPAPSFPALEHELEHAAGMTH